MSGSFQGPLLDLIHPPSFGHEQLPPRKSGSWLLIEDNKGMFQMICIIRHRNT